MVLYYSGTATANLSQNVSRPRLKQIASILMSASKLETPRLFRQRKM